MTPIAFLRAVHRRVAERKKRKQYLRWLSDFNARHESLVRPGATINENTVVEERVRLENGANFRDSRIGRYTYAGAAYFPKSSIGRFCSIASGAQLMNITHPTSFVSTWPGFFKTVNPPSIIEHFNDNLEFQEINYCDDGWAVHIGNDVWIGQNATIKGGVTIGDGAIIGADALVTKDVPPYAIVGGVPAKIIRYRFQPDEIEFLLSIRWWDWEVKKIREYAPFFHSIDSLKNALNNNRGF